MTPFARSMIAFVLMATPALAQRSTNCIPIETSTTGTPDGSGWGAVSGGGGGGGAPQIIPYKVPPPRDALEKAMRVCMDHALSSHTINGGTTDWDFPQDWRDCIIIQKRFDARYQAEQDAMYAAQKAKADKLKPFVSAVAQGRIK